MKGISKWIFKFSIFHKNTDHGIPQFHLTIWSLWQLLTYQFSWHLELFVDHFLPGDNQSNGTSHGSVPEQGYNVSLGLTSQVLSVNLKLPPHSDILHYSKTWLKVNLVNVVQLIQKRCICYFHLKMEAYVINLSS